MKAVVTYFIIFNQIFTNMLERIGRGIHKRSQIYRKRFFLICDSYLLNGWISRILVSKHFYA